MIIVSAFFIVIVASVEFSYISYFEDLMKWNSRCALEVSADAV